MCQKRVAGFYRSATKQVLRCVSLVNLTPPNERQTPGQDNQKEGRIFPSSWLEADCLPAAMNLSGPCDD